MDLGIKDGRRWCSAALVARPALHGLPTTFVAGDIGDEAQRQPLLSDVGRLGTPATIPGDEVLQPLPTSTGSLLTKK